jgi:thymidylate synthase
MTTYMRSNDAIWGLPYDCFVFTMLQELLASQLRCSLGEYVHFAASLHVYERHFSLVERMLKAPQEVDCSPMPPMPHPDLQTSLLS